MGAVITNFVLYSLFSDAEKREMGLALKMQLTAQSEQQSMQQLIQLQTLQLVQKAMRDDQVQDPTIAQMKTELNEMRTDMDTLKHATSAILSLLQPTATNSNYDFGIG